MKLDLGYSDVFAIADTAAKVLALCRANPGRSPQERKSDDLIRFPAVRSLRLLWNQADESERQLIAARIHIWLQTGRAGRFAQCQENRNQPSPHVSRFAHPDPRKATR